MIIPLRAQAANIKTEENPIYTQEEFLNFYPQFASVVPYFVLKQYINLGRACVSKRRYGEMWQFCIGLFVAHFCALYLQSNAEVGTPADEVMQKCAAAGIVTSESADGVSYSMDTSMLSQDLAGWAAFKLTTYGAQFATMARLVGKGGMLVW